MLKMDLEYRHGIVFEPEHIKEVKLYQPDKKGEFFGFVFLLFKQLAGFGKNDTYPLLII